MYTLNMATLQRKRSHGQTYWYVVESRRVNGKPRPKVLAYLGKPADLLRRLQERAGALELRSVSHGAVAALARVADELGVVGLLDAALPKRRRDGLSVGQSLLLIALNRACGPTSKRGWARWARGTSVGSLLGIEVSRLDAQHFWDQMDQVPTEALAGIEAALVRRVVQQYGITLESVFYDTTNFFTFMASDNARSQLSKRGHNKQKRYDLRQFGLALLVSRHERLPLLSELYEGSRPDVRLFPDLLTRLRERLCMLAGEGGEEERITLIYDKGNLSRSNQAAVDQCPFHYVSSLAPAAYRPLLAEANAQLEPVLLRNGERLLAYRTRQLLWGAERTLVVMVSERLREGQIRGVMQHLNKAHSRLVMLQEALVAPHARPRKRAVLERQVQKILHAQHLHRLLRVELCEPAAGQFALNLVEDHAALTQLAEEELGRRILMTDRHTWSTAEIIEAYQGQSEVERVFRDLKNPFHLAIRPVFHWTDQKLHVHTFCCVLGYLLVKALEIKARRKAHYQGSTAALLDGLASIRQATLLERRDGPGRPRVRTQLEGLDPATEALAQALDILE